MSGSGSGTAKPGLGPRNCHPYYHVSSLIASMLVRMSCVGCLNVLILIHQHFRFLPSFVIGTINISHLFNKSFRFPPISKTFTNKRITTPFITNLFFKKITKEIKCCIVFYTIFKPKVQISQINYYQTAFFGFQNLKV